MDEVDSSRRQEDKHSSLSFANNSDRGKTLNKRTVNERLVVNKDNLLQRNRTAYNTDVLTIPARNRLSIVTR